MVSAPAGIGPGNVPILQIVANTLDDLSAFQLAAAYSRAAPSLYTGRGMPGFHNEPV
ncbi:hypothetical protein [Pandoraea commovens]|uniref:Amidase n=1 Tax=Pandoraea commovens TaxID=2508289 RepID=A0ABY5QBS7_9BURK|nr:hypothetical protein [Pandoraea commovens]UVA77378.1 hypothetical protein NTU39_14740 [Pandoraea commovens]